MEDYLLRIVDKSVELKLRAFGATNIVGPKWCGKTTTAKQYTNSCIQFQKDPNKEGLIKTAAINPSALLDGAKPRLIDEWQDTPNIWDAVRTYCDEHKGKGHFILTGSTSKKVETHHTGTGRITRLKMYPMSLFESKESNGKVFLKSLFDGTEMLSNGCISDLTIDQLLFASFRRGWPEIAMMSDREAQLAIPRDYFTQIYEADIFKVMVSDATRLR